MSGHPAAITNSLAVGESPAEAVYQARSRVRILEYLRSNRSRVAASRAASRCGSELRAMSVGSCGILVKAMTMSLVRSDRSAVSSQARSSASSSIASCGQAAAIWSSVPPRFSTPRATAARCYGRPAFSPPHRRPESGDRRSAERNQRIRWQVDPDRRRAGAEDRKRRGSQALNRRSAERDRPSKPVPEDASPGTHDERSFTAPSRRRAQHTAPSARHHPRCRGGRLPSAAVGAKPPSRTEGSGG